MKELVQVLYDVFAEMSLALTMNYSNESNDGDAYVKHLIEMFKECIEMQKDLQKVIISGNQQTTRAINGSNSKTLRYVRQNPQLIFEFRWSLS